MLKMNLQLFAHKRVLVLLRTAVIPSPRDLAQRELMDSSYWQETSCTDSAVHIFILATT